MYGAKGGRDGGNRGVEPRDSLAGLQAGVLGTIVLVAVLMVGSLWQGRSIWVVPNLFATTFFGSGVYRNQLVRTSWTGIALMVAIYGLLGALWGCIWRDKARPWLTLYGAIAGLLVYYLFFDFLWRHLNPLISLYAPDRQVQLGHLLWGMVLARSPIYTRRIAQSTSPAAHEFQQDIAVEEVKSGEASR